MLSIKKYKIIALDLGKKSCGVAITDATWTIPVGITNIKHNNDFQVIFDNLSKILNSETIKTIVIGIPKNNGSYENEITNYANKFKKFLNKRLKEKVNIVFHNEAFSTKEAINIAHDMNIKYKKIKKSKDIMSAKIILESYLNKLWYKSNK